MKAVHPSLPSPPSLSFYYPEMKDYDALVKVFDIVREKRRDFLENYKYSNLPYRYIYNYIQQ